MADSTKLPALKLFQWSTPSAPNPRLASPIDSDDTTIVFTSAPLDEDDNVITAAFLMGVRNNNSYVETIYVPAGALSVDGLTATGCVRGINLTGIDYTVGEAALAASHEQDSPVFCNVNAVYHTIVQQTLQGSLATGGNNLTIGDEADSNKTILAALAAGDVGFLRKNSTSGKAQYSNDGTTWNDIDDVAAGSLVVVTGADTTPGNLNTKFNPGDGLDSSVGTPGGNETLDVSVDVSDLVGDGIEDDGSNNFRVNVDSTTNTTEINGASELAVKLDPSGGLTTSASGIAANPTTLITQDYTYGDTIAAGDVLYLDKDDNKLKVISTSADTWRNIVGVALDAGVDTDTNKRVLLKGKVEGASFSAIAPTFSNSGNVSAIGLNDASNSRAYAMQIDNSDGPEFEIASVTLPLRKQGSPGTLKASIVLGDSSTVPNFWFTSDTGYGAILGTATQSSTPVSGAFADFTLTFSSAIRFPANHKGFLVVYEDAAVDATNYFELQGVGTGGTGETLSTTSGNFWDTAINREFDYTLNVNSLDPWDYGYAVRCYGGTGSTITLGEQSNTHAWSRVIGRVLSSTEWYFDPNLRGKEPVNISDSITTTNAFFAEDSTLGFRPSSMRCWATVADDAVNNTFVTAGGVLDWNSANNDFGSPIPVSGTLVSATTPALYQDELNFNDSKWEFRVLPMETGYKLWVTRENSSGQDNAPTYGTGRLTLEFTQE